MNYMRSQQVDVQNCLLKKQAGVNIAWKNYSMCFVSEQLRETEYLLELFEESIDS